MREIATRFVLLLAAAGLQPMCALALEFDVTGAQSCSAIRCPSRYQRVEPPIKNPTGQGCNTDFRYVRCGGTADLMRTRSVLLERTPAVMRDGVPPHRQFRSDSSLSLYPVQWPVADNVWFEHLGRHRGRLDDGDSAAVIESWSTLAYRFNPDIGPSGIGFAHLDTPPGPFQDTRRHWLLGAQLLDNDGHDGWSARRAPDPVPEPGRLATTIVGLFGIYAVARRRIASI